MRYLAGIMMVLAMTVEGALRGAQIPKQLHWAVLVAGSNGFWNYRHQADVCHSYQTLRNMGVPATNIIVMIYDDVAHDPANPFPGQLYNKPSDPDHRDWNVYAGCQVDYNGTDVTAANFLNVLAGNSSAMHGIGTGRVLGSGPTDTVFVYFTDHGSTGLVAFPTGPFLYANQLNKTLSYMHSNTMYLKLVFYMEACESGSMFAGILSANMSIYVTTAANPYESSWGTYCPPYDAIQGVHMGTCLGDLYSVSWMEDLDVNTTQTLEQQYLTTQAATNLSHVMQYGDMSYVGMAACAFQGNCTASNVKAFTLPQQFEEIDVVGYFHNSVKKGNSLDARAVQLWYYLNLHLTTKDYSLSQKYRAIAGRISIAITRWYGLAEKIAHDVFSENIDYLVVDTSKIVWEQYMNLNSFIQTTCGKYDEATMGTMARVAAMASSNQIWISDTMNVVLDECSGKAISAGPVA